MPVVLYVVAAIIYNQQGDILLSSRPQGKSYAGYWEFAGGKVEQGETQFAALQRELKEELGIHIRHATPYLAKTHAYEHAVVHLRFFRIAADDWTGTPQAREQQQLAWQSPQQITVGPMLPANTHLWSVLSMPTQLSGCLKTGLYDKTQTYCIEPYRSDLTPANVMLTIAQLNSLNQLPAKHHVWAIVRDEQDYYAAENKCVSAVIWLVDEIQQAQQVLTKLQNGASLPIVVYATQFLNTAFAHLWQKAGAQAVVFNQNKEAA